MKKIKKKSKGDSGTIAPKKEEEKGHQRAPEERFLEEERQDFGGLPDRDLKKNLGGCG